jgi:hypothetical protein
MLDRDTKGHLALGLALVDCLAVAGMTLPQAQAFFLVAMDEGRSVSEYAERAGACHSRKSYPRVSMVQAAQDGRGNDGPRSFDGSS